MNPAKKNKINFGELITKDNFEVSTDSNEGFDIASTPSSNFLSPMENENQSIIKRNKKTKEFEYKKIFDNSLNEFKNLKKTAHIYEYNMDKLNLLSSLNKNVKLTEIINYVINDFFVKNSEEIKEENKFYSSELNKYL